MSKSETAIPNRLKALANNLKEQIEGGLELPTEIKESEKHLVHVLFVDSKPNFNRTAFKHSYRMQMYDKKSWIKTKDNLTKLGNLNVHVLHDPNLKTEEVKEVKEVKTPQTPKTTETKTTGEVKEPSYEFFTQFCKDLGFESGKGKPSKEKLNEFIAKAGLTLNDVYEAEQGN